MRLYFHLVLRWLFYAVLGVSLFLWVTRFPVLNNHKLQVSDLLEPHPEIGRVVPYKENSDTVYLTAAEAKEWGDSESGALLWLYVFFVTFSFAKFNDKLIKKINY